MIAGALYTPIFKSLRRAAASVSLFEVATVPIIRN
jgi:hypothetical protein